MRLNKIYIFSAVIVIVTMAIGYCFLNYFLTTTLLDVSTKNIDSFSVKVSNSVLITSSETTASIRVPRYSTVSIEFTGNDGYETGSREVRINKSPVSFTIDPYFSKDKLESLLILSKPDIEAAIDSYQKDISKLYTPTDHTLYHYGDWASVTLKWNGLYSQNTDNLNVLLMRSNSSWSVVGKPSILFFYKNYPDVPVDILQTVNDSAS